MRCFVFLYLLSFASYGSSCVQSDGQVAAWSSKYAHLFDVSAQNNNNSFSVYVSLPETIEERILHSVWIVVGEPNAPLIALPTTVFEEDGKTRAWFVAKPIDNEEYKFIFRYGTDCSISIEVPVEFKEKT